MSVTLNHIRRPLRAALAAAIVTIGALEATQLAEAAPPDRAPRAAQAFELDRLSPDARATRLLRVRVVILLASNRTGPAAAARHDALGGRLDRRELGAFRRSDHGAATRIARAQERERHHALAQLVPAARANAEHQRPLTDYLRHTGGRVLEHDLAANAITALVPRAILRQLARRSDVAAVDLAPRYRKHTLGQASAVVGAPTWWTNGHTGGQGPADTSPVDLAIFSDKIEQDHPAFAGIDFQIPPGSTRNTTCGQNANGCEHGTEVASMAISRGATGCALCVPADADKKGTAPGLDTVLDTEHSLDGNFDEGSWALGMPQYDGTPGSTDPAEIASGSYGMRATEDDNVELHITDSTIVNYGILLAHSAGNAGPAQSVSEPCIAPNALCVGGFSVGSSIADPSDDAMLAFSSRGPTPAGRKKPDIVAIASSEFANQRWDREDDLWAGGTGTSLAAPQAAGGAALLAGAGISDPLAQKALLINTARQGRATPSSAMGTQAGWQPDWGWGALDLDAAYGQRTNIHTATVPGGSARFYRATLAAPQDRGTIVWNRRADNCIGAGCQPGASTLTNLDLQQLDPATGAIQAQSNSAIDNVEQTRAPAAGEVIYKVRASSQVDDAAAEPYALAARRQITPLETPQPSVDATTDTSRTRPGADVTVTATVTNPSGDLTGENAEATLRLPAGVQLAPGSPPVTQPLGTLATDDSRTVTWTVRGTSDGLKQLTVAAQAQRYGETFTTTDAVALTVDGTGPRATIAAPAGQTTNTQLAVSWGATDPVGVAHYDVDVQTDGAPYTRWLAATTSTAATYPAQPGHNYRFRVRGTDQLGNTGAYTASDGTTVVTPPPGPCTTSCPPPPSCAPFCPVDKASPALRIRSVKRKGRRLIITGTIARAARGRVGGTLTIKVGRRSYRARGRTTARTGRFTVTLTLRAQARRARRGKLTLAYPGDTRLAKQTLRRIIRWR